MYPLSLYHTTPYLSLSGERELGRYECNGRQVPTSTHDILLICMYVYPCTFSKDILGMVQYIPEGTGTKNFATCTVSEFFHSRRVLSPVNLCKHPLVSALTGNRTRCVCLHPSVCASTGAQHPLTGARHPIKGL